MANFDFLAIIHVREILWEKVSDGKYFHKFSIKMLYDFFLDKMHEKGSGER